MAQNVGIGTMTPNASAQLDVSSNNKGILIPRNTTVGITAMPNPAKGLLVLDTVLNQMMMNMGTAASPNWQSIVATGTGWSLTGNSGTSPTNNFIGTTDLMPIIFKINNQRAGIVDSAAYNTSLGYRTLDSITTGISNTAFGYKALLSNSSGLYNTAVGTNALRFNTTGSSNTANGMQALLYNTTGNYNTANGMQALFSNTTGSSNTANGTQALLNNTTGNYNTANGVDAMYSNTTGNYNTANGLQALFTNTTGSNNTANGYLALLGNTTGSNNTANGSYAIFSNTTGNYNTANGGNAIYSNTTGNYNTAIGFSALNQDITGSNNIAIGAFSGTDPGSPNIQNTISIGNDGILNAANNQAFIGNTYTTWIGGNVTWSTFSDARIKTNIKENVKGLDFIMKLKPVTYLKSSNAITRLTQNKETPDYPGKYESDQIVQSGFLAQDVEKAAKDANYTFSGLHVPKNSKQLYSLSYSEFVVPLVKAMQEQQVMIETQNKKIELLEEEIKLLKEKK
jgi:hypothetical protein